MMMQYLFNGWPCGHALAELEAIDFNKEWPKSLQDAGMVS
jgi:hypothetical protein